MDHLFSSRVKVQRLQQYVEEGLTPEFDWIDQVGVLSNFACRLDLNFIRPGKDVLPPIEAGVALDRIGVMFCSSSIPIQAGDRVVTISGPVSGTFEIRAIPDRALDYSSAHHIEVQIRETNQTLSGAKTFPSQDAPPEPTPPLD